MPFLAACRLRMAHWCCECNIRPHLRLTCIPALERVGKNHDVATFLSPLNAKGLPYHWQGGASQAFSAYASSPLFFLHMKYVFSFYVACCEEQKESCSLFAQIEGPMRQRRSTKASPHQTLIEVSNLCSLVLTQAQEVTCLQHINLTNTPCQVLVSDYMILSSRLPPLAWSVVYSSN